MIVSSSKTRRCQLSTCIKASQFLRTLVVSYSFMASIKLSIAELANQVQFFLHVALLLIRNWCPIFKNQLP